MRSLLQDLRYGVRVLARSPGFTLVAVLTLALGIGANTAIFSVAHAVLLRPLPYPEPERLVLLSQSTPKMRRAGLSVPDLSDFKEQSQSFSHCAGFYSDLVNFGGAGATEQLPATYVTSEFFDALGARPALGHAFTPQDERPGASTSVIISHRLWQERFGGAADVVGRKATLDGRPFDIAGVMPQGFYFYEKTDLWLPLGVWTYSPKRSSRYALQALARLKPGVTFEAARAEAEAIAARLAQQYPESNTDRGASLTPLREDIVGEIRPALRLLVGAVGFVLLIACANVANLLLARSASRRREIAIRQALGAGRWRIARQLLSESLLLAFLGGCVGVLLAAWGVELLPALGGAYLPRLEEPGALGMDLSVLGFSLAVSLLAGLVFGLAPALRAARPELTEALKEGGRSATGGGRRLRGALVVSEVALALVLLVGAGLLVKSLVRLRGVAPGYNPEQVLTVAVSLPRASYKDDFDRARFAQGALERLRNLPGVRDASSSYPLPVYGRAWGMLYTIEGEPEPPPGQTPLGQMASVSPGFFPTLHIPLLQGRDFADTDTRDAPAVVIVDETLARRHWPGESAVGKYLRIKDERRAVVGVVGSVRNWGLKEEPRPQIYIPHTQKLEGSNLVPYVYLSLRTRGEPEGLSSTVKAAVAEADPGVAVSSMRPMNELLDRTVAQERFAVFLMELFAGLALLLASVGIYGVIAYTVTQRTKEIGIRVALGARARDVLRLVVGQGLALALGGIALGLAGAFALTRLLAGMLFEVSAADPAVYASVSALLLIVALLACYVPARRAMKVDPMVALRYE